MRPLHIAVVILNYNTEQDLQVCSELISKQIDIILSIIIVDNASHTESVNKVKSWLSTWQPDAICGNRSVVDKKIAGTLGQKIKSGQVYFIENDENKGYAAGNNVGIKTADSLKSDAVLIINPDVRIEDVNYLNILSKALFLDPIQYIAASRVVGIDGEEQNPLREITFWEELLWPIGYIKRRLGYSTIVPFSINTPAFVPKVSGCCLMLKMDFLQKNNYLDENTFLYCEEPILSAQVHRTGGEILFVPSIKAIHAHVKSEKGNPKKRFFQFVKSRKYYLKEYSNYSGFSLWLIFLSYDFLKIIFRLRSILDK